MNGWILLHKKIWESPDFINRRNKNDIILVWVWLLTHCDNNGVVTCGRNQIAKDTGINPSSVARTLSFFFAKANNLVNYEANSIFTKITILNWASYQRKVNKEVNNEVNRNRTASEQQVNTNKEIKNKEIKNTLLRNGADAPKLEEFGKSDINEVISYGNLVLKTWADDRRAIYNLLRLKKLAELKPELTAVERVKALIDVAAASRRDQYAPRIGSYNQLQKRWSELLEWLGRQKSKEVPSV